MVGASPSSQRPARSERSGTPRSAVTPRARALTGTPRVVKPAGSPGVSNLTLESIQGMGMAQPCGAGLKRSDSCASIMSTVSTTSEVLWTEEEVEKARRMAQRQSAEADREQQRLDEMQQNQPLIAQLGYAFQQRNVNMRAIDLLRSWHGKGEGGITPSEFASNVQQLKLTAQESEIEALFRLLDEDSNGTLGLNDLKPALVKLRDAYVDFAAEVEMLTERIDILRKRSQQVDELLQATPRVLRPSYP